NRCLSSNKRLSRITERSGSWRWIQLCICTTFQFTNQVYPARFPAEVLLLKYLGAKDATDICISGLASSPALSCKHCLS
ncbi:MAG TPA: hypothetical protein VE971_02180, partial [Candidatus Eisenbacteria bacterium]|nr:hypothetical protein [Candidatus Eisenbacteria bacterium]